MEDLYVKPEYRGKGIGLSLWKAATKSHLPHPTWFFASVDDRTGVIAVEENCQRFQWSVLDWNKPSIEFYKSQGGFDLTEKEGWHVFRMCRPEMEKFIAK
ncbi:hypothetical protein KUTeg_018626 [Tegillarca granosa]|uniref:N-acetyltransferase domain-containing protein n=1 Tax=Tegillarca granosa TaxID=220873 RepID=A0ABQ9EEU6_TEGGR|nr:hypothetical protein KUTeg_018626 [Tegillarca granosa]